MCLESRRQNYVIKVSFFLRPAFFVFFCCLLVLFFFPPVLALFLSSKDDPWQLLVCLLLRVQIPREKLVILFCSIINLRKDSGQLVWVRCPLLWPVIEHHIFTIYQNHIVRVRWQCQRRWGTGQKNQIPHSPHRKLTIGLNFSC